MVQRLLFASFVTIALSACAQGGAGFLEETGPGGGTRDSGVRPDGGNVQPDIDATVAHDAGALVDTGTAAPIDSGPPPMRDAGMISCEPGQHACGAGCIDDLPNEPANGCRLGCGEPCAAPTGGVSTCAPSGTCDFMCEPPFSRAGDTCVCTPRSCADADATCGAPDDGCGRPLDCGSCGGNACVEGRCACDPDAYEPNEDGLSLPMLAELSDAPDSSRVYQDMNLHSSEDVDWFRFGIRDAIDGTNPDITVTLDRVPVGGTYELSAFYLCTNGSSGTTCTGTPIGDQPGCSRMVSSTSGQINLSTLCGGFFDNASGSLFVRVRSSVWGLCNPYRLRIDVR